LANIETPLLAYLNAKGGAMKAQILYIVSTYGIPLIATGPPADYAGPISVDALLSSMYWNHANTFRINPYLAARVQSPPYNTAWEPWNLNYARAWPQITRGAPEVRIGLVCS
jgi:hypothetical protein